MSTGTRHRVQVADGPGFDCGEAEFVLTAAEHAGWSLPASCRAGICGTCEGAVRDGAFVLQGAHGKGEGDVLHGPLPEVKLCRVKPRSDLLLAPRGAVQRLDPAAAEPIPAKLLKVEHPCPEVAVLKLRFPAGKRVKFKAGQYLKVLLDDGQERCFSMANPPQVSDAVELHVGRVDGGRFSDLAFNAPEAGGLKPGDTVRLRLPLGDFHLREASHEDGERPIVLVAGGTGFAPIQSIVEDLLKRRSTRPVHLFVGARRPAGLYRDALARRWAEAAPWLRYTPSLSRPEAGDGWTGAIGRLPEVVTATLPDLAGHEVYACGSPDMVAAARERFLAHGLAADNFHCDAFAPSTEQAG
ncbi:2Fe-2S iron-sulfur cluster-binding protein [Aquabacterium sp. J223]|uniref:2Fe-2S iron-sulfur cluster-binding protein n=1 Tax=Aquabacterium sp. J223 TaxID=2898431 RepID=UPI0021ADE326|nr:2Fe-2S iron-sulfur cluster-binding protein [Aquabacterium sp. J223]UUX94494.1 2Fe-2S iron-sulfur cluster-binding protein [Aquabacterium sp. J223]